MGQRVFGGTRRGDEYGFGVKEDAHASGGELAAVAGVLDAAEGQARVAGYHGVEENGSALELGDEALLLVRHPVDPFAVDQMGDDVQVSSPSFCSINVSGRSGRSALVRL